MYFYKINKNVFYKINIINRANVYFDDVLLRMGCELHAIEGTNFSLVFVLFLPVTLTVIFLLGKYLYDHGLFAMKRIFE